MWVQRRKEKGYMKRATVRPPILKIMLHLKDFYKGTKCIIYDKWYTHCFSDVIMYVFFFFFFWFTLFVDISLHHFFSQYRRTINTVVIL